MTLYQVIHCAWRVQPWNQNMLAPWKKSYDKPSSVTQFCPILCDPMDYSTPGSLSITNSQSLLKLMSIQSVMPSNHLILCHPLLLLRSIFPSIRVFSNESVLHIRWPKYWSFSFNISPSNEYSGLISFRMDWLDTTERIHFHFSLSCIGEGNGNPLQCSFLEKPMGGGAW